MVVENAFWVEGRKSFPLWEKCIIAKEPQGGHCGCSPENVRKGSRTTDDLQDSLAFLSAHELDHSPQVILGAGFDSRAEPSQWNMSVYNPYYSQVRDFKKRL